MLKVSHNAQNLIGHGVLTAQILLDMIRRARTLGFALNDMQATPDVISIGLPIANCNGPPFAAVSIGAIASRMTPECQEELVASLREKAALGRKLTESVEA